MKKKAGGGAEQVELLSAGADGLSHSHVEAKPVRTLCSLGEHKRSDRAGGRYLTPG